MARESGSAPTDVQLRDWAKRMDKISWRTTVDALIVYRNRDREIAEVDGFPSGGDGLGVGPTLLIDDRDDAGPAGERIPCTPVEAAALRPSRPDPFHLAVVSALDMLHQAVMSADAMRNHIRLLDHMGRDIPVDVKVCQVCERGGVIHPPDLEDGAVSHGGQLPTSLWMCGPARDLTGRRLREWRKAHPGESPTWEVVLPSSGEIRGHEATGKWKVHA